MTTHISHIRISNILGVSDLEFDAGRFVEISGPNGSGKTSILEAIKATLKSGHDATLLRAGAESGEAVIVLDDGTEITKRVGANGSDTVVKDAAGKRMSKPGTVVAALADLLSVNPVDFLLASKKERVGVLLESMPIELNYGELPDMECVSSAVKALPHNAHALVVLETARKAIYDARTGTNRAVKEKHATINQLAETLPDQADETRSVNQHGLLEQLQKLDAAKDAELLRITTKLDGLRAEKDARVEALQKDRDEKVAELRRQIEELNVATTAKVDDERQAFAKIEQAAAGQRERTINKHAADTQDIRANLAAIQEAQKAAARHETTRQTIGAMREQADKLQADADAQTAALDALEAYKSDLLASLPIPGLTVIDGEIYRDGVQFDRLNRQQQVMIAVEIAKLRAGKLGVVCCDNLELLDSARLEEFKQQAAESGLQMFITRVSDAELSITNQE